MRLNVYFCKTVLAGVALLGSHLSLAMQPFAEGNLSASASASAIAATNQDIYLDALQAINEKRQKDAKEALVKLVEREPQHAGALLDLAIIQCELGNKAEAERLFQLMISRFAPPPAIVEIIDRHRTSGCTAPQPHSQYSVLLENGFDSNVNQGASNPNFVLGNAGSQISVQIPPEHLPKADHFTSLSIDYMRDVFSNGSSGFLQLRSRQYNHLSEFDTNIAAIGFESPWRVYDWTIRTSMMASMLTLDKRLYQKQNILQIRITPPLNLPNNLRFSILGSTTRARYPTLTNYDATTSEVRGMFTAQTPAHQLQASAGWLTDQGKDNRLGGNRKGWAANIQFKARLVDQFLGESVFGELGWYRQLWQSEKIYSPGIINQARRQDTTVFRAAINMPLNEHHIIQLEARRTFNRENISYFTYNSHALQLSWQWLQ